MEPSGQSVFANRLVWCLVTQQWFVFLPSDFLSSYEGTLLILKKIHFEGKPETPKVPNVFLCETVEVMHPQ